MYGGGGGGAGDLVSVPLVINHPTLPPAPFRCDRPTRKFSFFSLVRRARIIQLERKPQEKPGMEARIRFSSSDGFIVFKSSSCKTQRVR